MSYREEIKIDTRVTLEQYGIPPVSANQRLTPLDMNMPRLYGSRWVLCFPLHLEADKTQIYQQLKMGLAHTIKSFPWIAGNVGPEEGSDAKDNRIQIVDSSDGVKFGYNDLTGILPSYQELKKQHFPLSKLSTSLVSPLGVMPEDPNPVLAAQANFIEAGLLLTVGIHHSTGDATALETILDSWASNTSVAACGEGEFTRFDYMSNNRDVLLNPTNVMSTDDAHSNRNNPEESTILSGDSNAPPAGSAAKITDVIDYNDENQNRPEAQAAFQLPPMKCNIFYFSRESLSSLKASANAFSTHDALCGFLWQQMTLARYSSPSSSAPPTPVTTATTSLAFAVNMRKVASPPLPLTYTGNASMACVTPAFPIASFFPSTTTASSSSPPPPSPDDYDNHHHHIPPTTTLPRAAATIRNSLTAFKTPTRIHSTVNFLMSRPDPSKFVLALNNFLGSDIVGSSWADLGRVYDMDWGFTGMTRTSKGNNEEAKREGTNCESLRTPGEGADGCIMILPRTREGGLEVLVGLEEGAMGRLMGAGGEFLKWAEFRCG